MLVKALLQSLSSLSSYDVTHKNLHSNNFPEITHIQGALWKYVQNYGPVRSRTIQKKCVVHGTHDKSHEVSPPHHQRNKHKTCVLDVTGHVGLLAGLKSHLRGVNSSHQQGSGSSEFPFPLAHTTTRSGPASLGNRFNEPHLGAKRVFGFISIRNSYTTESENLASASQPDAQSKKDSKVSE